MGIGFPLGVMKVLKFTSRVAVHCTFFPAWSHFHLPKEEPSSSLGEEIHSVRSSTHDHQSHGSSSVRDVLRER